MTGKLFVNATVITPPQRLPGAAVLVDAGRIIAVGDDDTAPGAERVDLRGLLLAPGFIDIHVHGGGGFSLTGCVPAAVAGYAQWAVRHGVTAFLAGVIGDGAARISAALARAADLVGESVGGATLLGCHLEGPFLSPLRRGAFAADWLLPPDLATLARLTTAARGALRLLTIAPELPGALALISEAARSGVAPSLGHTDAGYEAMLDGFAAGARQVTHCFNAMRPFHHRDPGPIAAALTAPGVRCEVIADGQHVDAGALRLLFAARGVANSVLVTDGIAAAGAAQGAFSLAGQRLTIRDGAALTPDGALAGSVGAMDQGVRNAVRLGGVSAEQAITMASLNAAAAAGCDHERGRISPGYRADLVALTPDLGVAATWVGGRLAYRADAL